MNAIPCATSPLNKLIFKDLTAVNLLVAGSSPARGAIQNIKKPLRCGFFVPVI